MGQTIAAQGVLRKCWVRGWLCPGTPTFNRPAMNEKARELSESDSEHPCGILGPCWKSLLMFSKAASQVFWTAGGRSQNKLFPQICSAQCDNLMLAMKACQLPLSCCQNPVPNMTYYLFNTSVAFHLPHKPGTPPRYLYSEPKPGREEPADGLSWWPMAEVGPDNSNPPGGFTAETGRLFQLPVAWSLTDLKDRIWSS